MEPLMYSSTPPLTIKIMVTFVLPSAYASSTCGNQVVDIGEAWDDGNFFNGDGCSSVCSIEFGYTCILNGGGYSDWFIWGDGFKKGSEAWDDGNSIGGDGCDSTCQIELGYSWTGGSPTTADVCVTNWGDGLRIGTEIWDDANTNNGDGCDSTCQVELGYSWIGGSTTTMDIWAPICGDEYMNAPEEWDDGNSINGDGWDSTWKVEQNFICTPTGSNPASMCTPICGDGFRVGTEECDDGNLMNGDGCSSSWFIEVGWTWSGGSSTVSDSWVEFWSDGIKFNSNFGYCDDGNSLDGDGWNSSWAVEPGFEWSGGSPTTTDICQWMCGNYVLNGGEMCDDGNTFDGDGWSSLWKVEDGWKCTTETSKSICSKLSDTETQPEAVAVQSIALVGMAGSVVGSTITMSSPNGMWQTMNFIQLLLLLLLLDVHLPQKIIDFITSTSFFSLSFRIPFVENSFLFSSLLEFFDFGQQNPTLEMMGVENGSTLKNIFSQIFIIFVVVIFHLFAITLRNWDPDDSSGKFTKAIRWLCKRLWRLLTFTIYIRTILQWSQFMIIASVSEIYTLETKTLPHLVSFWIAWVTLIFLSLFFFLGTYLWYQRLDNIEYITNSRFQEFFSGLKKTNSGISFNLIILLRRGVVISWLVWFSWFSPIIHIISTSLLQFIHLCIVIAIRPFDNIKDNIVEWINESTFFIVLSGLTYFKDASKWSKASTNCYLYLMLFPGIFISLISFSNSFINQS
jgi:cysteine-rich repeat protein